MSALAPETIPRTKINQNTMNNEETALVPVNDGVGRLSIEKVHESLEFVRALMRQEMREGEDYGAIPGCGPKPTLLQPGAQKLLMTFNLIEEVKNEAVRDFPEYHREYAFTITVKSSNGKSWDGVGTCSTLEAKYRWRQGERLCPKCGKSTIIKGKEQYGGGWVCFAKKGGCGAKWPDGAKEIESQNVSRVEHDNPADYWNTVRKIAFKRALVAAAINATNTSELWTQDIEENAISATEEYLPKQDNEGSRTRPPPVDTPKAEDKDTPRQNVPKSDKPLHTPKAQPDTLPPSLEHLKNSISKSTVHPKPTAETLAWALKKLVALPGMANRQMVHDFLVACQILSHDKLLEAWPLEWVPNTKEKLEELGAAIADFATGGRAHMPYSAWIEPVVVIPSWQAYVITWGKLKDTALGQLPDDVLRDLWATFKPKDTYYDKKTKTWKPKWPEALKADKEMRDALDAAGKEKGFDQPAS